MQTMTKNVAVIGSGYWGKNLVRNFNALGVLRAVVESSPPAQATAKQLAPDVTLTSNIEDVLKDSTIKAVVISTPAYTHHDIARKALEADKDVFVEKPLTLDVHTSRDL